MSRGAPALGESVTQLGERLVPLGVGHPEMCHTARADVIGCHTWIIGLSGTRHKAVGADAACCSQRAARGQAAAGWT